MELTQIAEIVATWAAQKPLIRRVYLFGSRVRGTYNETSDLDVAIELDQSECRDECQGMATWICETQGWKPELDAVIPHEVQVVRYAGNDTPVIEEALKVSRLLVYEKP
jgi:predicted nucleotidyltransferase